jgi:DNA-binding response OmpR family regulator
LPLLGKYGCDKPAIVRKKILVVEDDQDLAELLSFNLRNAGFAIGTASDGVEALKKARSAAPDLILLDLMLPELDGFAVCEILRHDPATASVPIIMLTAMSGELARLAGLEAGANDYITKPFSPRQLLARVEAILGPLAASRAS